MRADQQFGDFARDVDEAVSLTYLSSNKVVSNAVDIQGSESVQRLNNPSDSTVKSGNTGTKVSGDQGQGISGSVLPFYPERNHSQANADRKDNLGICEDLCKINSFGLSDIHFDVVRKEQEVIDICACTLTEAREATSEQQGCWGLVMMS